MAGTKTIQSILHNPRLPSLPAVAIRMLELTRDDNVNFREVADIIQNDQALSIKIIRTVNSSYFGLVRPCTSINQAIVFLGIEAVKTLVLGFSLVDSIDGSCDHDIGFDYASYWRRSLHSAVAAREIAQLAGTCDPEEAFLAAQIQDIGMVALYRAFGDIYIQILDLTYGDHSKLIDKERRSLEMDHAEVGAAIGEFWQLPDQLVNTIRFHHDAKAAPKRFSDLIRIIELAGWVADMLEADEESSRKSNAPSRSTGQFNRHMRMWIGLEERSTEPMLETIRNGAKELASLFKVNISTPIEVDQIMGEAEDLRIRREITGRSSDFRGQPSGNRAMAGAATATATSASAAPRTAGLIVSPPIFRQQLRAAISEAEAHDGCVGVMICEIEAPPDTSVIEETVTVTAGRIAEEVGSESVITTSGSRRVMLFLPRADRITIARLAHTIRQHCGVWNRPPGNTVVSGRISDPQQQAPSEADSFSDRCPMQINIGAAAYDKESSTHAGDEQKLIALAEQALNRAMTAGPGAVRVFNPTPPDQQAA